MLRPAWLADSNNKTSFRQEACFGFLLSVVRCTWYAVAIVIVAVAFSMAWRKWCAVFSHCVVLVFVSSVEHSHAVNE